MTDAVGEHLRTVGQEVGTTTGRPRRCGWFDAVVAKFATQINGLDGLAITKLDVFDGLSELKIGIGYRHRTTGNLVQAFPASLETLAELEPVYETLPGWQAALKASPVPTNCPRKPRPTWIGYRRWWGSPFGWSVPAPTATRPSCYTTPSPPLPPS